MLGSLVYSLAQRGLSLSCGSVFLVLRSCDSEFHPTPGKNWKWEQGILLSLVIRSSASKGGSQRSQPICLPNFPLCALEPWTEWYSIKTFENGWWVCEEMGSGHSDEKSRRRRSHKGSSWHYPWALHLASTPYPILFGAKYYFVRTHCTSLGLF